MPSEARFLEKMPYISLTKSAKKEICGNYYFLNMCLGEKIVENCINRNSLFAIYDNGDELYLNYLRLRAKCELHSEREMEGNQEKEDEKIEYQGDNNEDQKEDIREDMLKTAIRILTSETDSTLKELIVMSGMPPLNTEEIIQAIYFIKDGAKRDKKYAYKATEFGAIPILINLLNSSDQKISIQALNALEEMIQVSHRIRNYCIKHGIMDSIVTLLSSTDLSEEILASVSSLATDIFDSNYSPLPDEIIFKFLEPINNLLLNHKNETFQYYVFLNYGSLLNDELKLNPKFVKKEIIKKVISLMNTQKHFKLTLALLIGIIPNTDEHIKFSIENGILKNMKGYLNHEMFEIKTAAVALVYKITLNENPEFIQAIFDANILPEITKLLTQPNYEKMGIEIIKNIVINGNEKHLSEMVAKMNIIKFLCDFLIKDKNVYSSLTVLKEIISRTNTQQGILKNYANNCPGVSKYLDHENEGIQKVAQNLIIDFTDAFNWYKISEVVVDKL